MYISLISIGVWLFLGVSALLINYKYYSKRFPPRTDCINVILFGLITLIVVLGVIYEYKIRYKKQNNEY
jgi:hypothetical protein